MKRTGPSLLQLRRNFALEYLCAPMHVILTAAFIKLFGSYRQKVLFDQVRRRQHAFGILEAADIAKRVGAKQVTVVEFGVASGAGLMNLAQICEAVTKETGISFRLIGFDVGKGLPSPIDYRDHPEMFQSGDYPMVNPDALKNSLPSFASLIIGDVKETVPKFLEELDKESPIGYVVFDLDYYSSTVDALAIFEGDREEYLPVFWSYFDDVSGIWFNDWCGELLAINEFNEKHRYRKLRLDHSLMARRVFKNAQWLSMVRSVHILDHPFRSIRSSAREAKVIGNTALGITSKLK
ncbi:MAG: hypothetical protein OEO83_04615 [Alphaproteobacteria bacterium]|nr:hypothetical protein [Alphaproteobacteria bacterium]